MPCNAPALTTTLNPELVNELPSASPMSERARPTVPVASLVLPLLSLAPLHTSTPSMPAHPEAVVSAAQPLTSRFDALLTVARVRGVSIRPTIVLDPLPSGPASHEPRDRKST